MGNSATEVVIPKDATVAVDIKLTGYVSKNKVYYNKEGFDVPPVSDIIILKDRLIDIRTKPADAIIYANGEKIKSGDNRVIIPESSCVTIKVAKDGYVDVEKKYCNNDGAPLPPAADEFVFTDRIVRINTTPPTAAIKVDGKEMAKGEYTLRLTPQRCVEVWVENKGYVPQYAKYCNQPGENEPPVSFHNVLRTDEAYSSTISTLSDKANINFVINTSPARTEEESWKLLTSIITSRFDEVEQMDMQTGYLKTNWILKSFGPKDAPTNKIRTRVIIKRSSVAPLVYTLKICSECLSEDYTRGMKDILKISAKDDQEFMEWDRILNIYNDLISEVQSRMQ